MRDEFEFSDGIARDMMVDGVIGYTNDGGYEITPVIYEEALELTEVLHK